MSHLPHHRIGTSSLEPAQWAALQRAGWICLNNVPPAGAACAQDSDEQSSPRNLSRAGEHYLEDEEMYLTPGTVEGSAAAFASAFKKSQFIEVSNRSLLLTLNAYCDELR